MKQSKWLSYENGLLVLLGISFGLVAFDRNAVTILTPFIIQDFELSNAQIGLLSSGLALAMAISAYFVGAWSDKSGSRKPFLIISVIIFSLCSVLSGIAGSFMFLIVARVVMGAAEGPFLPVSLSVMNAESSPHRRGLNAGIIQSVFASLMATTLAPIVLVYLAELYNWQIAFFITGVPGLICAFLIWKYVREPKTAESVASPEVTPVASGKKTSRFMALQMLGEHNIKICCLVACFMVAWFLVGMAFYPLFFTSYRGFTPTEMSGLMAGLGVGTVVAGFLVPALSDRIGRKPVVIVFCFISLLAPLTALYFEGPLWVMGILLLIGWSGTGVFPLFMAVIPGETVSPKFVATSMGLVVCVGEVVGGALAPYLAGLAADQTSLATPIIVTGVCALCAGLISFALIETAPGKSQLANA